MRYCLALDLYEDATLIAEYEQWHRAIWPEIRDSITGSGITEMEIWRLEDRLFPMLKRALGWQAQHIERYLICRYGAEDQGFFSRHRDDVTAGTAHRKFAVSLNLNDGYEGGDLRFPEFGPRTYRPPAGGATVFACGLLHEATPVTKGERFVFVP